MFRPKPVTDAEIRRALADAGMELPADRPVPAKLVVDLAKPDYSHMQSWFKVVGDKVFREVKWHLHDGVEAMYCDPMGRRTPCRVLRVHNSMATVEWESGNSGRASCRRLGAPTYEESKTHFAMIDRTNEGESL